MGFRWLVLESWPWPKPEPAVTVRRNASTPMKFAIRPVWSLYSALTLIPRKCIDPADSFGVVLELMAGGEGESLKITS